MKIRKNILYRIRPAFRIFSSDGGTLVWECMAIHMRFNGYGLNPIEAHENCLTVNGVPHG